MKDSGKEEARYRRVDDEASRLLIVLNERVAALTAAVEKLTDKQSANPCKTHELRLRYMEKIMWLVIAAMVLLSGKAIFNFFASSPIP